ncbi:MAG: DUF3014 domain-containing protein [Vicinamibacterales bacterium]
MADPDQLHDVPDLDIRGDSDPHWFGGSERPKGPWIAAGILIVAALAAAFFLLRKPSTPAENEAAAPSAASAPAPAAPLGGDGAAVDVPPLDQTDALVRDMVRQLTSHPSVAAWLTTEGLLRNFTVVVANVADGASPSVHLGAIRPTTGFQVVDSGRGPVIDPRSYQRYDTVAAAVEGIDPAGAAKLYSTFKPRLEEAYRDLGHPDTPFDRTVETAIVELLETPVAEGNIALRPAGGVGYAFADPNLESLTAAQRQLLRTGPENMRGIQQSLRSIALALGIPADRLPAPRTVRGTR